MKICFSLALLLPVCAGFMPAQVTNKIATKPVTRAPAPLFMSDEEVSDFDVACDIVYVVYIRKTCRLSNVELEDQKSKVSKVLQRHSSYTFFRRMDGWPRKVP